jgi:hypothetical protein
VIGVLKKKRTPGITEPHSSTVSFSLSREERRHARGESGHLSSHCGVGWRWRDGCNTHGTRSWSVEFNRFRVGPGCLHAARVSATPHALGVRRRAPLFTGCRTAAVVEGLLLRVVQACARFTPIRCLTNHSHRSLFLQTVHQHRRVRSMNHAHFLDSLPTSTPGIQHRPASCAFADDDAAAECRRTRHWWGCARTVWRTHLPSWRR